ncbi:MAG: hypothetical protein GZ089_01570 [Aromatoleum sp.]|nr:hypothetical protein [Aromatoleum sp.]
MTAPAALPLAMRRVQVQRRATLQRAAIGAAWDDLEIAAARGEARTRRALEWTRRASRVAMLLASWWTLRRLLRGSMASRAMAIVALVRALVGAAGLAARLRGGRSGE